MKRIHWNNLALGGLALLLAACASNPAVTASPAATAVALAATATTVPPSATLTATNTATAAPTDTAAPSATASASATATATDTATPKPTETATATASPRPTRRPETATVAPTATDSLPAAPLYPKSPIVAWSRDTFIKAIADSRKNTHDYYDYHGRLMVGATGYCTDFWASYATWERQPGFTEVPAAWYPLYYQLRTILQNIQVVIQPIVKVCLVGGGHVDDADDQKILAVLGASVDQLDQLGAAAQAMAP